MASENHPFRRLPGRKKNFFIGYYTLWQGKDHLLQVFNRFGVEDYKRFYFEDIQAVVIRLTHRVRIQNILLAALAVVSAGSAVYSHGGMRGLFGGLAALLSLVLLINWIRGPSCETVLMTAVQSETLYSLHRLKNAERTLNSLRGMIEAVQGNLAEIKRESWSGRVSRRPPAIAKVAEIKRTRPSAGSYNGRAHAIVFWLLLGNALAVLVDLYGTRPALTVLHSALLILTGIMVMVALVKQHESGLSGALAATTWCALAFVLLSFATGYAAGLVLAIGQPERMTNQWELFKMISSISAESHPWLMVLESCFICSSLALGLIGLVSLRGLRSGRRKPVSMYAGEAGATLPQRGS